MNRIYLVCTIIIILLSSCWADKNKKPIGAIPIVYADYIFIQGNIDDSVKGNFLLDTGADNLYLDSVFYKENNLFYPNLGTVEVLGIGNSVSKIQLIKDSLKFSFGQFNYKTSFVPILKLKPIGGDFIDGLFGLYYFKKNILEINYFRDYIATHKNIDSIKNTDISRFSKIKMDKVEHFFCVTIQFNIYDTIIKGKFLIDVGVPITTITSGAAKKYKLSKNIKNKAKYYTKYGGVGGESSGYDFIADSLKIGNYTLDKINMSYSLDEGGMLSEGEYLGILGNNILDKFDLIFDFKEKYFYLNPNETYYEKFEFDKLGFTYVDRYKTKGGWIVTGLTENSDAEKKIKIDDKIISVNGIPVQNISLKKQKEYFKSIDKAIFTIKNDTNIKTVELNLEPILQ